MYLFSRKSLLHTSQKLRGFCLFSQFAITLINTITTNTKHLYSAVIFINKAKNKFSFPKRYTLN